MSLTWPLVWHLVSLPQINMHSYTHTHRNQSVCTNKSVAHVPLPDATLWEMRRQWNVPFIWSLLMFMCVNASMCWVHVCLSNGVHSLPPGCLWCSWLAAAPGNTLSQLLCWLSRLPPPPFSGPSTGRSPCRQHTETLSYILSCEQYYTGCSCLLMAPTFTTESCSTCIEEHSWVSAAGTHGETKFFCMRKAEVPQSFHSMWWCAQSSTMSISANQWCCHSDEKRGVPSPSRLRLHGRWVNAVTTSGSLCLIWAGAKHKRHAALMITVVFKWLESQLLNHNM